MRTLIVYGTNTAMSRAMSLPKPDVHFSTSSVRVAMVCGIGTIQSLERPDDVVQGVVISGPSCLERLRGFECDVVIEDASFDLYQPQWYRSPFPTDAGPIDLYEQWRLFLLAYVLRR